MLARPVDNSTEEGIVKRGSWFVVELVDYSYIAFDTLEAAEYYADIWSTDVVPNPWAYAPCVACGKVVDGDFDHWDSPARYTAHCSTCTAI